MPGLGEEGREIFNERGSFSGSDNDWRTVIQHYAGNPKALQIVASRLREDWELNGSISKFRMAYLESGRACFKDIDDLLKRQFDRLSILEQKIMYWLAINRDWISFSAFSELFDGFVLSEFDKLQFKESLKTRLNSLKDRDLIDIYPNKPTQQPADESTQQRVIMFTQQPVIMEFAVKHLVERLLEEIRSEPLVFLKEVSLIQTTNKDYIRNAQIRIILKLFIDRLLAFYRNETEVKRQLDTVLCALRDRCESETGYAAGNIINILCRLKTINLGSYDFSHLIIRQAYLENISLRGVNFAYSDLGTSTFSKPFNVVFSIAYSPNGEILATGHNDGEICLWDTEKKERFISWQGHDGWINSVAYSPTGELLVSGDNDKTIKLWKIPNDLSLLKTLKEPKLFKTLEEPSGEVHSVTFSPNGDRIASGGTDHIVRLRDIKTGECLEFKGHSGWVETVIFSPDGHTLASASWDTTVKLWDVHTGECLYTLKHSERVAAVAFSPKGDMLASGGYDKKVKLWDVRTGECLHIFEGHNKEIWSIAFCPTDGRVLASSSVDTTVRLWDTETGRSLRDTKTGQDFAPLEHNSWVHSIAFSPDGKVLASGSYEPAVKFWDIQIGQCMGALYGYINCVHSIAFNPNGEIIASCSKDQIVRLWDVATNQYRTVLEGHTGRICSVAFSPDGHILATANSNGTIGLWYLDSNKLYEMKGHSEGGLFIIFSHDGKKLASSGQDAIISIWDVENRERQQVLEGRTEGKPPRWIRSVAFSLNGKWLVSGSDDWTVKLWDVETGECLKTFSEHISEVPTVAFSPNNRYIASGSWDKTIKLWDTKYKCIKSLPLDKAQEHEDWILSVAFDPNSRILASGSEDKTVKLWNIKTGKCLATLKGHKKGVRMVAFSPSGNGRVLASCSDDETIRLWEIRTDIRTYKPKETLVMNCGSLYEGMNITGVEGLTDSQKRDLKILGAVEK